jgi:putative transposase
MPYLKVWIHVVWATKNRQPVLTKTIRDQLFPHIKNNGMMKMIHVDFVNGYTDHVHCLVSLAVDQTIARVVQQLKGESSYWVNQQKILTQQFEWQSEYFAVSVSESAINKVREYIKNQEAHHERKTFQHEYDEFIKRYGFTTIKG